MRYRRYLPGLRQRQIFTRVFTGTPGRQRIEKFNAAGAWQDWPAGQMLPPETVESTPVYRIRLADNSSARRVVQYSRALVQFCRRPDTRPDVIQFLPLPPWSIPALIKLRRLKIPMAYAYNLLSGTPGSLSARFRQLITWRWQFPLLDCLIVQSSLMQQTLRDKGCRGRIEIIPNGVDTSRFKPAPDAKARNAVRHTLGIGEAAPVIIYVGAVEPRKGSDLLFSAWAKLARRCEEAHLLVVGPRLDLADPALAAFHNKLEDLLTISAARERVHFVGKVENVETYLQTADLFVFPSRREGFPNVVLEAMAAGLPVITTPFYGLSAELGRPGEHYLLAAYDAADLCRLMERVLANKPLAAELGRAGRGWVMARMDIEAVLDQYAALYRELVAGIM